MLDICDAFPSSIQHSASRFAFSLRYHPPEMKSAFLDKLVERIDRVGQDEVQSYLLRLAEEKGFLETIFNAIHEGVIVTAPDGHITFLNHAACELFGLDADTCLGRPLSERVPGLDWATLVSSENIVSRDMQVFYPRERFLNFYVVPLTLEKNRGKKKKTPPPDRELIGYAVILRDITETRKSTAETIESERLSALTLLAAGVAHEVGNPLNSLHIHMQLMERKLRKLPPAARKDLLDSIQVARDEVKRLDHIVTQFLRAIRPAPLDRRLTNINDILREATSFLSPETESRDVILELELRANLPLVEVDRDQLKQAFYNVIKNSLQAMNSGGILRIVTDASDEHVAIRFSDTGGGIAPEVMSRIFDPYVTTKKSGTGLGLLVVRRIVREHGGEIDIINDEGRGITLTIRLPLRERLVRMLPAGTE
jgi:two-component system, sporulation sensor kinase E